MAFKQTQRGVNVIATYPGSGHKSLAKKGGGGGRNSHSTEGVCTQERTADLDRVRVNAISLQGR